MVEKHLLEMEKINVTSIFSFSHNVSNFKASSKSLKVGSFGKEFNSLPDDEILK